MIIKSRFPFASAGGGVAILLGAFGAHGLKGRIEEGLIEAFQTGVQYQIYHCLALLIISILMREWGRNLALDIASYAFMLGVLLFSGSLYLLALTNIKWLGPITPIGGLCFIVGWCALLFSCYQSIDQ